MIGDAGVAISASRRPASSAPIGSASGELATCWRRNSCGEAKRAAAQVAGRHLRHFLELAELAYPELQSPRQQQWLARLDTERDNLRAALRWSLRRDERAHPHGIRLDEDAHTTLVQTLRAALSASAFASAWEAGRAMRSSPAASCV